METGSKMEKLVIGAREIRGRIGRYLLQGLVMSAFLHSATIGLVGLWPEQKKEERRIAHTDTLIVISPPRPDNPNPHPPRPRPLEKPDVHSFVAVDEPENVDTTLKPADNEFPPLVGTPNPDEQYDSTGGDAFDSGGGVLDTDVNTAGVADQPIFIPRDIEPVALDINPQPEYPEFARAAGVGGTVHVWVRVNTHGGVDAWQVIDVNPAGLGFEDEVAKVVPRLKFTPAIANQQPVTVWVAIPFRFRVQ